MEKKILTYCNALGEFRKSTMWQALSHAQRQDLLGKGSEAGPGRRKAARAQRRLVREQRSKAGYLISGTPNQAMSDAFDLVSDLPRTLQRGTDIRTASNLLAALEAVPKKAQPCRCVLVPEQPKK